MSDIEGDRKSVSRHGIVAGTKRDGDVWYDVDAFLHDQVEEVLFKLSQGSLDDAIWGKIAIMEKNHRVAKVYLRNPTVIIDGSEEEFDGKTLGFNAFPNERRDDQTAEIKQKIKEGVILKMDLQGNIKGMARGAAPVYAQGWREPKHTCLSEKLIKMHGKITCDERAYKIFDMKRWKVAVERFAEGDGEMRSLLSRACIRVSLAKDGKDISRTPCWFAIVNLVALDMLVSRCPHLLTGSSPARHLPVAQSLPPPAAVLAPVAPIASSPPLSMPSIEPSAQLPSIVAAVAAQMNHKLNSQLLNSEQLAQIASAVAAAQNKDVKKSPSRSKKDKRRNYRKELDSDDSSEDSAHRSQSSSSNDKNAWMEMERWKSSLQSINLKQDMRGKQEEKEKPRSRRPRLDDVLFSLKTQTPSSTSDYDSTKEPFDSSSCSSTVSHSTKGIAEVTKSLMTHAIVHQNPLRDSTPSPTPLSCSTPIPTPPPPPPPPSCSPPRLSPPTIRGVTAVRPSPRPSSAANGLSYGVFNNATSSQAIYEKPQNVSPSCSTPFLPSSSPSSFRSLPLPFPPSSHRIHHLRPSPSSHSLAPSSRPPLLHSHNSAAYAAVAAAAGASAASSSLSDTPPLPLPWGHSSNSRIETAAHPSAAAATKQSASAIRPLNGHPSPTSIHRFLTKLAVSRH